ncbi:MAG: elongation factor G [Clostridia bacterium]|uniref:elongation factor G n=1 Tax=Mogibacterium TaxID=86331 RepID=UPI00240A19E6|nr:MULTISPECIES: elongation factor G [Mogibacterium]MCI7123258.1 elongation factor G [Mogibacterium sp.]MDD6700895.1 elongation factor G [Mogibacterium kristiansenii]MDY5450674.1 elongation factor G [Clostridia bacterium]
MKGYSSDKIRNVVLLGHGGCGKTTFLEAALLATKVINRLGKVEDGNTVSDYDKMEIEKKYSINTTMVPVEYNGYKYNFLDTPGFFDFVGEVDSAMSTVSAAIIMVDASEGIQVGTEKAWELCSETDTPKFMVLTKIDKDSVDCDKLVEQLREKFGNSVVTDDDEDALREAVAGTDEALMEKFFNDEPFTDEEFTNGLMDGIANGDIVPIIKASSFTGEGIDEVLRSIARYVPTPSKHAPYIGKNSKNEDVEVITDVSADPVIYVYKTIADPFMGKISYAKVLSGTVKLGQELYNPRSQKSEKLGSMFFVRGKQQENATEVPAGDMVALAKLQHTKTGDTLCLKAKAVTMPGINFPKPNYFVAVEPAEKKDEEKMAQGLHKLMEEDPSFVLERNVETHQSLLGGQGDIQIGIIRAKLKERYGVSVKVIPQKIAYRETIKGSSDVQGKHKKQSGGAGQYGDVWIRFSPSQQNFEFSEELFGGSIPKNYVPAVEKGLLECMDKGPLAGCKVQNVKAVLYDGSYHDVDSNEVSFKIAASLAFKKGIVAANPCLLEPIMKLEITVPEKYTGDVMGDMNKRRGRILGMEPTDNGKTKLLAEAPQSELFDYAIVLRAMTQARGTFTVEFSKYEELPAHLAEKVIEAHKAEVEKEHK